MFSTVKGKNLLAICKMVCYIKGKEVLIVWLEQLKEMKRRSGLTTSAIAEQSGIPEPTLEKLFAGATKEPKLETMKQLVHFLGYSLDDLYTTSKPKNVLRVDFGHGEMGAKKAPPLSGEAMRLAKDYDSLDRWGRQALRELAETELQRMEDEKRFQEEAEEPETPPVINLFINPSAAGPALGETGQSCVPYELKPEDPRGAAYAIRVQGNSMEPDFPDESIVFVNHDEMRDGDIGVFCVDGATVIKQWHYDRMLGITYLFSLNRKRSDADLVITASSGRSLVWQGRVMTKKRYPLPGR